MYVRKAYLIHKTTDQIDQVEGEAQGGDWEMGKFLKDIEQGPRGASVKQVEQEDRDVVNGEAGFEVRR